MYGKSYKRLVKSYLNHDLWYPGQENKKKRNEVFDAKLGSLNKYSGTVAPWMVLDKFQLSSTQKV